MFSRAMELRKSMNESSECTFQAMITADYGDVLYEFHMDCAVDSSGNVKFSVVSPESIAGITGIITAEEAAITFDDKVLAFPMLADAQITPVTAPWIFIRTLRGGFLTGCSKDNDYICLYLDDSYEEQALHLEIYADLSMVPQYVEVIWKDRHILTMRIKDFTIK